MPRLLWLMFQVPMSSPQITRMFGRCPDGAAGSCWACAVGVDAADPSADAAASVVPASRILRRLMFRSASLPPALLTRRSTALLVLSIIAISSFIKDVLTPALSPAPRNGSRHDLWTCRPAAHAAPPGGSAGNSSVRTGASRL